MTVSSASQTLPDLTGWSIWMQAIRPATLAAGAVPVVLGVALAMGDGVFAFGPAVAAFVGALLIQIATNLANDYFDFAKGADNAGRVGPVRVVQQGWVSPRKIAVATGITLIAAALVGAYLVSVAGLPILVVGVVSLCLAVGYTGGPYPLAYHGLGDLFVLLFFGFVAVGGTYFVQAASLTVEVILAGGAVGCLATGILVVNNLRDRYTDYFARKRTLVVRWGGRAGRWEFTALVGLAYCVPLVALGSGVGGWGWVLPLLSLPLGISQVRQIWQKDGRDLNTHLGQCARLELVFGVLLAVGVAWGGIW